MTYLLALLGGIAGAAVGAALGMGIGAVVAPMLGITSLEGFSGYFATFISGPIGGLLGLVTGAVLVLRKRGHQGFGAIAGRVGLVFAGIVAVAVSLIGFL